MNVVEFIMKCRNFCTFTVCQIDIDNGPARQTPEKIWQGRDYDVDDMPEDIAQRIVKKFSFETGVDEAFQRHDYCTIYVGK